MASNQCSSSLVLGKSLWSFISGPETRHIYQLILAQIRKHKRSTQLFINCDSPELKRNIEVTLNPLQNGGVEFLSKVVQLIERDAVTILDKAIERSDDIIKICSFCKKIAISKEEWAETQDAIKILNLFGSKKMPQLSHGICPHCAEIVMKDIEDD